MDVVGDLLARERRSRDPALVTRNDSERSYRDVITNAYKSANVLRHLGAREGATVAVTPDPDFHTTLAFLGAARLGARVRFDPDAGLRAGDRVVLMAVDREGDAEPSPGTNLAVYGGKPNRPETTHWEAQLWSENPGTPPSGVEPDDPVLVRDETTVSHADALAVARDVVETFDLDEASRVVVRTTFADPGAVVAGVIAPLLCGGATVLAGPGSGEGAGHAQGEEDTQGEDDTHGEDVVAGPDGDDEARGDLAVVPDPDAGGPSTVPESRRLSPPDLSD